MRPMNQNGLEIRLRTLMGRDDGWGHEEGRRALGKLLHVTENQPRVKIISISLEGVARTDASFPRESVVELARHYRGKKGVCLTNFANRDLMDNWDAAALKKEQPLIVWNGNQYTLLGPPPSLGNKEMLEFAMNTPSVTASAAAKALDLKIANASMKLKQLEKQGYLLREEMISPSGGKEYVYFRIK